jgi:hypothetical protein
MTMLKNSISIVRAAALAAMLLCGASLPAQNPTATGVINGTLINKDGISLVFNTDPAGVTLGAAGTAAASANFGTVSAFGPLSAGVTRTAITAATFTVRTVFDVQVIQGGLTSATYSLSANLAAAAPTGFTYKVDAVTLTTAAQTIQATATYNTNIPHNLDLTISRAAPGAGGPAVNTPVTATINFVATAN